MRLVHSVVVTPHLAGIYETAREIVAAERSLGHDAWMYDPQTPTREGADRGVPYGPGSGADVIIDHSGVSETLMKSGLPIVHCRHGRPRSTFLIEQRNGYAPFTNVRTIAGLDQYKAFITFWPEHQRTWEILTGREFTVLPPPVDLEFWNPKGPSGYEFHGKGGQQNVVCAEVWRDDVDPFNEIIHFIDRLGSDYKLHFYGNAKTIKPLRNLFEVLKDRDQLGEVCGWVAGLDNVYRAADSAIVGNTIATRSVREAMACGCPVIGPPGSIPCGNRAEARHYAEQHFDPADTARGLIEICERII